MIITLSYYFQAINLSPFTIKFSIQAQSHAWSLLILSCAAHEKPQDMILTT